MTNAVGENNLYNMNAGERYPRISSVTNLVFLVPRHQMFIVTESLQGSVSHNSMMKTLIYSLSFLSSLSFDPRRFVG